MSSHARTETLWIDGRPASALRADVARVARAGATELRVNVGMDAARADVVAVLGAASRVGLDRVSVVLGGDAPASTTPLAPLAAFGIEELEVTVHSASARVHDALERRSGALERVLTVVGQARAAGVGVRVRMPLWSRAAQDPASMVALVAGTAGPGATLEPELPSSLPPGPNGDRVCPPGLDGVRTRLANLRGAATAAGLSVELPPRARLPLCALPATDRVPRTRVVDRLPAACAPCALAAGCHGPPGWYVERHGSGAVEPVPADELSDHPGAVVPEWPRFGAHWDAARSAAVSGDEVAARDQAWRALGFAGEPPAVGAPGAARLGADDTSARIARAVAAAGVGRLEEVAYLAGIKPVLYLTAPFGAAAELEARYSGHEVVVVSADRGSRLGRGVSAAHAHVFVGRRRDDVERVAAEYRAGDPTAAAVAIGGLMGYPRCCCEAFAQASDNRSDSANVYRVASRTAGGGAPLLNLGVAYLVPFYPCRFDCEAGEEFASRTLAALLSDSGDADLVRQRMDRPTLYFDKRRSVVFEGTSHGLDVAYASASTVCRSDHAAVEAGLIAAALGPTLCSAQAFTWSAHAWKFASFSGSVIFDRQPRSPGILLPFGVVAAA